MAALDRGLCAEDGLNRALVVLRSRAIELGVNDYLGKPYQDAQLLEAIRRQLEDKGIELP